MPRRSKNQLSIRLEADGRYHLFGRIAGQKVRRWSRDLSELETMKTELENNAATAAPPPAIRTLKSWFTPEQLRDAEALFHEFRNYARPVAEYARAGLAAIGKGERVKIADALELWEADMREQKLFDISISSNLAVLKKFLDGRGLTYLDEITGGMIEDHVASKNIAAHDAEKGPSLYSKLSRATPVRTFLNFCLAKRLLNKSPFGLDMKKLVAQATRHKSRPQILSPEQADALLQGAISYDARWVPFIIFSTWCFLRAAEAARVLPEHVHLDAKVPFLEIWPRKHGTASHRTVNIPANLVPLLRSCMDREDIWAKGKPVHFTEAAWKTVREKAGLVTLGPRNEKGFRAITGGVWQENILRHTGISYLYQHLSVKADKLEFGEDSVIAAVCRQAGNSSDVAFRHYVNLAAEGSAAKFYAIKGALKKQIAQPLVQLVA